MPVIKPSLTDAAQARAAMAALDGGTAASVGEVAVPIRTVDALRALLEHANYFENHTAWTEATG